MLINIQRYGNLLCVKVVGLEYRSLIAMLSVKGGLISSGDTCSFLISGEISL